MHGLARQVGQFLQIMLGDRQKIEDGGNPLGDLKQAQGEPVFAGRAVFSYVAALREGS